MQPISTERVKDYTWLGGQGDPLEILQETEVWPCEHRIYAQPRICSGEWDTQTPLGICNKNGTPNLGQTTRPCNNQQK